MRGRAASRRFCASTRLDPELGRSLEILTLGEPFHDAEGFACFSRAAIALCALSHPGVPTLYAVSTEPPELMCGQLEGSTLREVCRGLRAGDQIAVQQFTLVHLLSQLSRLCAVLVETHREGFVHRAIGLDSVVLGGFGDVYLREWWYAQLPERYFESAAAGSQLEYMRGLPAFSAFLSDRANDSKPSWLVAASLAPELRIGWRAAPAADVWCIGQLLSEALGAWRASAESAPPAKAEADLALHERAVALAERASRASLAERFQTARQLQEQLDSLLGEHRAELQDQLRARAHRATGQLALAKAMNDPGDALAAKRSAMVNLSRALALNPHDTVALRLMRRLFARTDDVLAGPVGQAFEQRRIAEQATGSRASGTAFVVTVVSQLGLLLVFPQPLWREAIAIGVSATVAFGWIFWVSRLARPHPGHRAVTLALVTLTTGLFSLQFGPLVYAPAFTLAGTVVWIVNLRPQRWLVVWALALMLATVVIPSVLMQLGVYPVSYLAAGQALVQRSGQTLAEAPTLAALAIGAVLTIVVPLRLLGQTVDRLNHTERSLYTQAWLLRELLPDEASDDVHAADAAQETSRPASTAHQEAEDAEES